MVSLATADEFLTWLYQAGVIGDNCRRVVIDADSTKGRVPVLIYAELYGTSEMIQLKVPEPLLGAQVRVVSPPTKPPEEEPK